MILQIPDEVRKETSERRKLLFDLWMSTFNPPANDNTPDWEDPATLNAVTEALNEDNTALSFEVSR